MDRLRKELYRAIPPERTEEYSTLEGLSNGLRRPMMGQVVVLLLAETREALAGLLSIGDLLQDMLIILIVPDRDKDTVSSAHALWPRYLTFSDSAFADVAAVVGKMLENMDSKSKDPAGYRQGFECR